MISMKCHRLQKLNLAETEMVEQCYCNEHDNVVDFTTTTLKQLRVHAGRGGVDIFLSAIG